MRPTKQRIKICEALFDRSETFHFTIRDLYNLLTNNLVQKISLATVYNTVHAFQKKGYLKEISIGDYVVSGGDLASMVVLDSVIRLIPKVIGNDESLQEESFNNDLLIIH